MLNITLPPLSEPVATASPSRKRKRKAKEVDAAPPPLDARLEFFMDKLAIWQLTDGLAKSFEGIEQDDNEPAKDWAQTFCEDVVEQLYVSLQWERMNADKCALTASSTFCPNNVLSCDPSSSANPVLARDLSRLLDHHLVPAHVALLPIPECRPVTRTAHALPHPCAARICDASIVSVRCRVTRVLGPRRHQRGVAAGVSA